MIPVLLFIHDVDFYGFNKKYLWLFCFLDFPKSAYLPVENVLLFMVYLYPPISLKSNSFSNIK